MKKLLKKSFLIGMGVFSLTREKAEKLVQEMEEKGEVTSDEAKDFVNELVERGEQERSALNKVVASELDKLKNMAGVVTKKDLAVLEERLQILEERLQILEKHAGITWTASREGNLSPEQSPPTQ